MSNTWVRCTLTAELLSDAHLGSGSGGGGIDALIVRDRYDRPVIWASHVEGVLRDAARRLWSDKVAETYFGRAGGQQQCAVFTSLYAKDSSESHIWSLTAREAFDNCAPKEDTLRIVEYVPKGTKLVGEVELPDSGLVTLRHLVQEVDALGSGRSTGAGRVKLSLSEQVPNARATGAATGRLVLLLKNRDPLCITATATPDNLIPSLSFVPGRALLGAVAAWLIGEGDRNTASILTSGKISISDALPLPEIPTKLESIEVLPAPLSLQSEKPKGAAGDIPWWAQPTAPTRRLDAWVETEKEKLRRPEEDLFVYRENPQEPWKTFKPPRRVRLRNGRPDPEQVDASLFAIEQIVEDTCFFAELDGTLEDLRKVAEKIAPVLEGRRWLRIGRGGAPVEVAQVAWLKAPAVMKTTDKALLTLTSDLLVRDEHLRWRTELNDIALKDLLGNDIQIGESLQDNVMIHGFNGTSRLWRMPAAAVRRGSVFKVSGTGVPRLAELAASGKWLGERTHEGFGRFRIDASLPGITGVTLKISEPTPTADSPEEEIAAKTQKWFNTHQSLAFSDKKDRDSNKPPSLSQWLDLVADLERGDTMAISSRLTPSTAGGRSWKQQEAKGILNELNKLPPPERKLHARLFVRWLRAHIRKTLKEPQ